MGTRADFYVGRGASAEWIGSIAWDGYPVGITTKADKPIILAATTEADYREQLARFLAERTDATLPARGWPWPWNDSGTTDYAYAFDDGKVYASCFRSPWWVATDEQPDDPDEIAGPRPVFPQMKTDHAAPAGDGRSGIMVFGV